MRVLDHQPEEFSPTGNLSSEGVRNQLGRPDLDPLVLLVRETVQNSWDAKRADVEAMSYSLDAWELTDAQRRTLRDTVFGDAIGAPSVLRALGAAQPFRILSVADRGTAGLGGPTRADVVSDEVRDFVDFVRNVGQPPDKEFGGGTYGYGKASLYINSLVTAVCIHSRCRYGGRLESRFIVTMLGNQFEHSARRFTGRHWWGRRAEDGVVDPLTGDEADQLARSIGLTLPSGEELGSTICILQPDFRERSPRLAVTIMAESLAWFFWPKMLASEDHPAAIRFRVSLDGEEIAIPDPTSHPGLCRFARVWTDLHKDADNVTTVRCERPKQVLGQLALREFPERGVRTAGREEVNPFSQGAHHIALMRQAKLVVKYLAAAPHPEEGMGYAGVFVADAAVDRAFAASEPPSHDDWVPTAVADRHSRTFVQVGLRRIREAASSFVRPAVVSPGATGVLPLGAFSEMMGDLIPGEEGPGARIRSSPAPRGRRRSAGGAAPSGDGRRPSRIFTRGSPQLVVKDGARALAVRFGVSARVGIERVRVTAFPFVQLDGGAMETEPPEGADAPRVLEWSGDGLEDVVGDAAIIRGPFNSDTQVVVSVPDEALVGVRLRLEEVAS